MDNNNYDSIADLYDIYVPATFDIPFFLQECRKTTGEVLELMSGTGRVSLPLIEAGVKLTCVDLSGELNAILAEKLRQRGFEAAIIKMDVCELDLRRQFALIIIPFHSFAHIVSREDQEKSLKRIYGHLLPGGTFICTLGNPIVRQKSIDGQLRLFRVYPLDGGGSLLLWIKEDLDSGDIQVVRALQFFEEYDAQGGMNSKRLLELHFRLTGKEEFEKLAKAAGFTIKALYGDYTYAGFDADTSPYMIWILGKED